MVEGAGQSADNEKLDVEKETEEQKDAEKEAAESEEISLVRRKKSRSAQQGPVDLSAQPVATPSTVDDEQNKTLINQPPSVIGPPSLVVQKQQENGPAFFLKSHFANALLDSAFKNESQDQAWKIAKREEIIHGDAFKISKNVQGKDVGCEVKYQNQAVEFSLLDRGNDSFNIFQETVKSYLNATKIMQKEVEFELIVDHLNDVEGMLKGLNPEIANKITKFTLRRGSEFTPISKDFVDNVKDKLTSERQSTPQPPRQRL